VTLVTALAIYLLAPSARAENGGPTPVIASGQEEVLGAMLGAGASWTSGCELDDARIEHSSILVSYNCPGGQVRLHVTHPKLRPGGNLRTRQLAVTVTGGTPPPGFLSELEKLIVEHEAELEWTWISPPPTHTPEPDYEAPSPSARLSTPGPSQPGVWFAAAAGVALLVLAIWLVRRSRQRRRSAAQGRSRQPLSRPHLWMLLIFLSSGIGRAWLSIVNPVANDDHLEVARLISENNGRPPASAQCMQCAHPKLYHHAVAALSAWTDDRRYQRIAGNLLNFAAGTILLLLLATFLRSTRTPSPVQLLAVGFASFNAGVVGIFSQATNDGFCILFSSLAIFFMDRLLRHYRLWPVVPVTVFLVLAALSKASGWAIFAASLAVLVVTLISAPAEMRRGYAAATLLLAAGFLLIVTQVHPYRENLQQAGTPFVTDAFDAPLLKLEVRRPPYSWMVQDLLTFRIFALLRTPYMDFQIEPRHRTSLWTQVYGRALFLRFDQPLAPNLDPRLLALGRLCFLLGMLPLAAVVTGAALTLRSLWRGVIHRGKSWLAEQHDWIHVVYAATMVTALLLLVAEHHRQWLLFTWMKAIYLMPAILAFFRLMVLGLEAFYRRVPRLVTATMSALIVASCADLIWLIHDWSRR
jgi:hypothetical protein